MTNRANEFGNAGIYRSSEPTLSNEEGSALALSPKGNSWIEIYPWAVKTVEDGGYTYVCVSTPGTAVASAYWRIFRTDATGNLIYADGNADFVHIATDPTSLSYSYT